MRGTQGRQARPQAPVGIIPAHAGNTIRFRRCRSCPWDHPRACGEHAVGRHRRHLQAGIIPAHAGNTANALADRWGLRDHPRACGEHHERTGFLRSRHGIIPAHAGNTAGTDSVFTNARDHPRACGEHLAERPFESEQAGSSPRMRGTQSGGGYIDRLVGIIPAHAGNTVPVAAGVVPEGDHPRACGEHRHWLGGACVVEGSSPRMRGTLLLEAGRLWPDGIIPAHAGNTASMAKYGLPVRDHPRACGEHLSIDR